jgi:zinc/manganese transport system substrate-binding protein
MLRYIIILTFIILIITPSDAKLKIVTSTPELAEFAKIIGGEKIEVDFIVRGTQNPHYIEIKPSYMMKLRSADLFLIVGMGLELWSNQIVDGSRNEKLVLVDCSQNISKLEVPTAQIDASQGDVHPYGNPHYWLDPDNVPIIMQTIAEELSKLSPVDRNFFTVNMESYLKTLRTKIEEWKNTLSPWKGFQIISYHTSFSYFANRFGLMVAGQIEPKPGIPPTPSHTLELIQLIRKNNIRIIGVEQFYDENTPQQIAKTSGADFVRLTTAIGGREGTGSYIEMMDYNVRSLTAGFKEQ